MLNPREMESHMTVHVTVYPPSTLRSAPVTYADASDSKKVTGPIRSTGAPMRP